MNVRHDKSSARSHRYALALKPPVRAMQWPMPWSSAAEALTDVSRHNDKGASHQEPSWPRQDGFASMEWDAVLADGPWAQEVEHDESRPRHSL